MSAATNSSELFKDLCISGYTTTEEQTSLRACVQMIHDVKDHYYKYGEYPQQHMQALEDTLRAVAKAMSVRCWKDRADLANRGIPVKPNAEETAEEAGWRPDPNHVQASSHHKPCEFGSWSMIVTLISKPAYPEDVSKLSRQVSTHEDRLRHVTDTQKQSNTVSIDACTPSIIETEREPPSIVVTTCPKSDQNAEPSTTVALPDPEARDQGNVEWDFVGDEHEEDDVASLATAYEDEEDFENIEASSGEEDYDHRRPKAEGSKMRAMTKLFSYGVEVRRLHQ